MATAPTTCTIKCPHNKGLHCGVCYDQTYGALWEHKTTECVDPKARNMQLAMYKELAGLAEVKEEAPSPTKPYRHPFLNRDQLDSIE